MSTASTQPDVYERARRALAVELTPAERAQADAEREATLARIRAAERPVPAHLQGKLYSPRDTLFAALSKIDAEAAPGLTVRKPVVQRDAA